MEILRMRAMLLPEEEPTEGEETEIEKARKEMADGLDEGFPLTPPIN